MHPKKRTVGVRIPDHVVVHALLEALGEPLLTSTLILPGRGGATHARLGDQGGARPPGRLVIEAGETPAEPTTVVDWSEGDPEVVRLRGR